ncbi:unnamed protein product [Pleuronectes platessa]|uniref:Uncharacterized protein n=1 Tax=Pleuronectes platessa TaxID=8262 RepID=A0A9N7U5J4_PLEPL|nr:unnamed protein product [Pleuronectes platessa]
MRLQSKPCPASTLPSFLRLPRPFPSSPPAALSNTSSPRSAHLLRPPLCASLSLSSSTAMLLGSALVNDFLALKAPLPEAVVMASAPSLVETRRHCVSVDP